MYLIIFFTKMVPFYHLWHGTRKIFLYFLLKYYSTIFYKENCKYLQCLNYAVTTVTNRGFCQRVSWAQRMR